MRDALFHEAVRNESAVLFSTREGPNEQGWGIDVGFPEAGCGAGWQSLALARASRFELDLLDFSPAALETARGMGIVPDRVTAAAARAGHIGAAGLPIALSQAWGAGSVGSGDLVCLAAVGAGINWGAVIVRL